MVPERAHVYWNGTFSDAQKAALLYTELPAALNNVLADLRSRSSTPDDLARFLWFDQKYFLPDDILNKSDRMSSAHSLEVRPPFLDHRIVEFAASLPASLKIGGSEQKVILEGIDARQLPLQFFGGRKSDSTFRRTIGFADRFDR
jgi:asparagine synthase (glutamine-hydrolysing)